MSKKAIAIIVVAQNISQATIDRFSNSVKESKPSHDYEILIGQSNDSVFFKTKILNGLIRKAIDKFEVIIQTDIDLIVPPELINQTYQTIRDKNKWAYHHALRYLDPEKITDIPYKKLPFNDWKSLPSTFCSGCWNGMNVGTWRATRGYNEEMFAWGFEDTEFFKRSKRLGVQWIKRSEFPLVHINHSPRQRNRVEENTQASAKYSDKTDWLAQKLVLAKVKEK